MAQSAVSTEDLLRLASKYKATSPDPGNPRSLSFPSESKSREFEIDLDRVKNGASVDSLLDDVSAEAPIERSWTDTAASTALRVIPAVAGGMAGALAGPLAPYAVPALGAAGATLGEYLAGKYEGEDATPSELATSALIGALPTGKLVTGAGQAVLRTIAPGVERKLAGALASKAAPSGASAFERLKSANMLGLAAKGAAQGAPTAAIENTVARTVQGQPTTAGDIGRDLVTGAAAGAAFPVVAKGGQTALRRVVAPTSGSGLVAWLRNAESIDTKAQQELNASLRAKGLPEIPSTASTAAKRGVSGSIEQQQDQVKAGVDLANTRIRDAVSQENLQSINVSNVPDLVRRLDNMAAHFDEQDMGSGDASTARRLSNAIAGRRQITPEDALDLKQFLDKNRSSGSYTTAPANATAAAGMKKLSDSIRGDLKRQLPGVAKALDYAHEGYDLLDDLYVKGAAQSNAFSSYDAASLAASGVSALVGQPEIAGALVAAGLARRAISRSPSTRSKMSNLLNVLSGNSVEAVPDVGPLPTTRGLLERGSIPMGSGADPSGRIPSEPFISRVIPRIEAGSPPPSANQAPPRTGGPNERGGFGGINTMGPIIGEGQVPFNSGTMPLGGIPSRGNAPVQTLTDRPPVLRGVAVDELGNEVGVPPRGTGEYIDAEVVSPTTRALPRGVYAMPSGETPVSSTTQTSPPARSDYKTASEFREEARQKAEKLAESRQKLAPTVPAKPAAAKTVVQATTPKKVAVDTPKAAASEVTDEINRVIDVEGTTKAIEIKRRVLAALMEEMEPAKKAFSDWDTSGIDSKGRKVNIPPPYTQTITLTIPGDGTFRINRTPDAIAGVIKRLTKASSTAFEGLGSVTSTRKR